MSRQQVQPCIVQCYGPDREEATREPQQDLPCAAALILGDSIRSPSLPTDGTITLPTLQESLEDSPFPHKNIHSSFTRSQSLSSCDVPLHLASIARQSSASDCIAVAVGDPEQYQDELMVSSVDTGRVCSYEQLLEEASNIYGNGKPKFCIFDPGETERLVKLSDRDDIVQLVFRSWKNSKWGYWLFVDGIREEYIVKCIRGQYFAWQGERLGFSTTPIAEVTKNVSKKARRSTTDNIDAELSKEPHRDLRTRTMRQEKPYQMYNAQKKMEDRGVSLTEEGLERRLTQTQLSCSLKRKAETVAESGTGTLTSSRKHLSESSVTAYARGVPSMTQSNFNLTPSIGTDDTMYTGVVLRTRLNRSNGAYVAVSLAGIEGSEQLFHTLRQKWAFRLAGESLTYCVAKFEWLDEDGSILIQESDKDGFRQLFEEIKRSPAWQAGKQVNVALELYTNQGLCFL